MLRHTRYHVPPDVGYEEPVEAVGLTCAVTLHLSFFFDGTGNNRTADEPTQQQTNVAKLFRSHWPRNPEYGLYPFYIPGVGTYFPQIGDEGGKWGLATGNKGQARIDWAIRQFDKTVAKHPPDKLVKIRVAAFGFSRGAAEARAFANQVAKRCQSKQDGYYWDTVDVALDFYFLGLFDTVASVGLAPMAGLIDSLGIARGKKTIKQTLDSRRTDGSLNSIRGIAFGKPGADPTPYPNDGHMTWGGEMEIPDMVKRCISLISAHEQRNSFPLDSIIRDTTYPPNCKGYMYPGAHSDVGGGYRPGDQNKNSDARQLIALMPLHHMHAAAIDAGVPFQGTAEFTDAELLAVFETTQETVDLWDHYMDVAGRGNDSLGNMYLSHMRLWFAWRFHRIHQFFDGNNWSDEGVMPDQEQLEAKAEHYEQEREKWEERVEQLEQDPALAAAKNQRQAALEALQAATTRFNATRSQRDDARKRYEQANKALTKAKDPLLRARERLANVPDGMYLKNVHAYDVALIKDVQAILAYMEDSRRGVDPYRGMYPEAKRTNLRPFYRMIVETYEAEFLHGQGIDDEKIIAFFDHYVHDSLAGFATDATAPSDPRCVYIGGDHELKYAGSESGVEHRKEMA